MPDILGPTLLVVVGLCVLLGGGEVMVRGATGLAAAARISPLIIGLTVVAFGTSSPELAVVLQSTFQAQADPQVADVAIGNVVGSCIFNVLFVLGLTALVRPMVISAQLVRLEVPLMIAASFALLFLGLDGSLGRVEGLGLFGALIGYIIWTVIQARRESRRFQGELQEVVVEARAGGVGGKTARNVALQVALVVAGLVLLTLGSNWLVNGSVTIARLWGVSELMIGLTIVAVGTSLPEIVTSVLATVRGHSDIAVGNVVGSNIFNILCVLGIAGIVAPDGIPVSREALSHDIPVMIAVAVACLPIFFTGYRIRRWEGGLFFAYYVAYTTYLILAATQPGIGRTFAIIMLAFVVPLTAITLLRGVARELRARSEQKRLSAQPDAKTASPTCSYDQGGSEQSEAPGGTGDEPAQQANESEGQKDP